MNVSIISFGAVGDGIADDSVCIQKALDSGNDTVDIPEGTYRICNTLKINSNTHISAHKNARLFMCGETPKFRNDFLISNSDIQCGNVNISITGGIWDGNNTGKCNKKAAMFDENGYSGTVMNFVNVKNLNLTNLNVANSVAYNIRMSKIEDFVIRDIGFSSENLAFNQDGLHFGGGVKNGLIENISALTKGQTNDDMIALNADDSIVRVENRDLIRGDIENLTIRNIYAQDCYTFIRLLSVDAAIRNIKISNIKGGCRKFAINMDAARYCATTLFKEDDVPNGVGVIENVEISDMDVYFSGESENALILCETNANDFKIKNFNRDMKKDMSPQSPVLVVKNVKNKRVTLDGSISNLKDKNDSLTINDGVNNIFIDSM